jgi:hypothetical protein
MAEPGASDAALAARGRTKAKVQSNAVRGVARNTRWAGWLEEKVSVMESGFSGSAVRQRY